MESIKYLQLLHLADSALPIGSTAHSFGLETLAATGNLTVDGLFAFLHAYIGEVGRLEAAACFTAFNSARSQDFNSRWLALNGYLDGLKTARESREASATLGRRLLQLALTLEHKPILEEALDSAKQAGIGVHHSAAFGLIGGVFELDHQAVILSYLQQWLIGLISACQRLMPLGQHRAHQILWTLKPALIDAAAHAECNMSEIPMFTPCVDVASMQHPKLETRLFIS